MATTLATTVDPWQCECGAAGVRNLGTRGYCMTHLSALYATFAPESWSFNGVGLLDGKLRPDWGPTYADVRCVACGATWVGEVGEPCAWCAATRESMLEHQRDLLLTRPELDPGDRHYDAALLAWSERLARGVQAGIVEQRDAANALQRQASA